jgi:hypothetical protein
MSFFKQFLNSSPSSTSSSSSASSKKKSLIANRRKSEAIPNITKPIADNKNENEDFDETFEQQMQAANKNRRYSAPENCQRAPGVSLLDTIEEV